MSTNISSFVYYTYTVEGTKSIVYVHWKNFMTENAFEKYKIIILCSKKVGYHFENLAILTPRQEEKSFTSRLGVKRGCMMF